MAETLLTVRTEVSAGGLSRFGTTVLTRLVNDAYAWLVKQHYWPFREATSAGAAPLTIADLGAISSVTDTANGNNKLDWCDRRTLVESYGDLTLAGTPNWFYVEGGTVVKTYPAGGTLSVRYFKNAALLVADGDTLIVPDSWVQLVIDRARYRGFLRLADWEGATTLKAEINETLQAMIVDLMSTQLSDSDTVTVRNGE